MGVSASEKKRELEIKRERVSEGDYACVCVYMWVCLHHCANTMGLEVPRHLMNVCLSFRPHTPLFI